MNLYPVNAGYFKLDGGAMFGVVPKSLWHKHNPADENNLCNWAMRCLLVDTGTRRILIDNGMGDKQDAKFFGHYYLNGNDTLTGSLQRHGFTYDDITDVLLTHLHFDHCGGSIVQQGKRLVPAFKNARYWSCQRHWEWATIPNDREKASFLRENILPIAESGKLQFLPVTDSGTVPFDDVEGLAVRYAFGHTDAMIIPQITVNGKTVVFMADLLPSPAHMPQPWVMAYDMFPLKTMEEKKAFLEEAADNNYILFFEHDPTIEACTVRRTDKGVRVKASGTLDQMLKA